MLVIRKSNLFNFHLKNKSNMKNRKIRENPNREIYRIYLTRSRNSKFPSCIIVLILDALVLMFFTKKDQIAIVKGAVAALFFFNCEAKLAPNTIQIGILL